MRAETIVLPPLTPTSILSLSLSLFREGVKESMKLFREIKRPLSRRLYTPPPSKFIHVCVYTVYTYIYKTQLRFSFSPFFPLLVINPIFVSPTHTNLYTLYLYIFRDVLHWQILYTLQWLFFFYVTSFGDFSHLSFSTIVSSFVHVHLKLYNGQITFMPFRTDEHFIHVWCWKKSVRSYKCHLFCIYKTVPFFDKS